MESSKKKRNSVLPIIVSVGIATSMGVVANSTPEVAYASSNAAASTSTSATYADRSSSENVENQVIDIPDKALKSKLLAVMKENNYISSDATDITIADAERLDEADLSNKNTDSMNASNTIHNLKGLEHFKNLTRLNLDCNNVTDFTALKGLTSLTKLSFENNKVSDLTTLSGLTSLTELDLDYNNVTDFTALKGLTNLTILDITDNNISDVTGLGDLTNLIVLNLSDNNISDITALSKLTNLQTLYLRNNNISDSDITALSSLKKMDDLFLDYNNISDITALSKLNLNALGIGYTKVSDISVLRNFQVIRSIDINGCNIPDINVLGELSSLGYLDIRDSNISDISVLRNLPKLIELLISGSNISNLSVLENSPKLEYIYSFDKLSIDSTSPSTSLIIKGNKHLAKNVVFTVKDNSLGSINNGTFTINENKLPYSGTVEINFTNNGSEDFGYNGAKYFYLGTITLNLNVPKTDSGVTTWVIKAKMKYEPDPTLKYQEKKVEKDAKDGKKENSNGIEKVVVAAQDGVTKVGNKQVTHEGKKIITTTYTVNPDTGELTDPHTSTTTETEPPAPTPEPPTP
ncbi:MAG: leucine-rich repeat domain-containing protein, partial [Lactobacillus crispatus]|nr:leucine-rich repeat domain-containing protein [Lactobacillus crispatus]